MAGAARNVGLDILRSTAIVIVLANHALHGFLLPYGHLKWGGKVAFTSTLSNISIEWLFVLSGFLIGTMMIRSFEQGATFWARAKGFWLRRWFRTLPTYYLFLLVNVLLVVLHLAPGRYSFRHALFAQNLLSREGYPFFFNEAWSLALDEWFYLVMPPLVGLFAVALRLKPRTAFLLATASLIAFPTALRFASPPPEFIPNGDRLLDWDLRFRRVTVQHLDATGWGLLAATLNRWWPGYWAKARRAKALAGGLMMALGLAMVEQLYFGGFFPDRLPRLANAASLGLMGVGTFLALPWIASLDLRRGALRWVVERITLYSYSIYLCHLPLLYLSVAALPASEGASLAATLAQIVAWLAATLGVAALTYHKFEKPVSDLRERYTRKVDAMPFAASAPPP